MRVVSSCFDSLVWCSALEVCLFLPLDGVVRWMTSWLPTDELLRSGNRLKPQHWKSNESTEVEETSAEEDQDWNDDSDADWPVDSEGRSSLSGGSVCALVASDGQASLRRSISETDLLVSEEEVNRWDTQQYLSDLSVAGFEESEREDQRTVREGVRSGTACIALRCTAWCRRRVSCLP